MTQFIKTVMPNSQIRHYNAKHIIFIDQGEGETCEIKLSTNEKVVITNRTEVLQQVGALV